eukprot:4174752-Amphidinium_carterae.2
MFALMSTTRQTSSSQFLTSVITNLSNIDRFTKRFQERVDSVHTQWDSVVQAFPGHIQDLHVMLPRCLSQSAEIGACLFLRHNECWSPTTVLTGP